MYETDDNIPRAEIIRFSWKDSEKNNEDLNVSQEILRPGETVVYFEDGTNERIIDVWKVVDVIEEGIRQGKILEVFAHLALDNSLLISRGTEFSYSVDLTSKNRIIPIEYGDRTAFVGILEKDQKTLHETKQRYQKERMDYISKSN